MDRRGAEVRDQPVAQVGVDDVLLDLLAHLRRHAAKVNGIARARGRHDELLAAVVRDEQVAQLLGVRVDVQVELGEDGEPDVVGPEDEVVVLVVGGEGGVDEAVAVRGRSDEGLGEVGGGEAAGGLALERGGGVGALEDLADPWGEFRGRCGLLEEREGILGEGGARADGS